MTTLLATLHDLVVGLGLAVILGLFFWGISRLFDTSEAI